MLSLRPVAFVLGALIIMLAIGMIVPALADLSGNNKDWQIFALASGLTALIGGQMMLANRDGKLELSLRQAFIMTVSIWVFLPAFAALPFAFSGLNLSFVDAYFEAMSGLTTTGATVISGLDAAPPGILLWRALLEWFGGIGIVVMAVAVMPMLQVGGMQLFKLEGYEASEKILPRAAQISGAISALYVAASALLMLLLMLAGMNAFDAMVHSMTAIATGGFSSHDASVGYFDSGTIEFILAIFMIIGSLPFILLLQVARGRPLAFWRDEQVRAFLGFLGLLILSVTLWLVIFKDFTLAEAFRYGGFNIISILTGTGFVSTDYAQWGAFSTTLFFFVMFIGGCAGSTSCGIKIFRFQVLFKAFSAWKARLLTPSGVFIIRYNGQPIQPTVISSVMSYFTFFIISFFVLATAVTATGVDWVTALSGTGSALANVGPGLGDIIGPQGNYESLPDSAKVILSLAMLIGRLEFFAVLVVLAPSFWRP